MNIEALRTLIYTAEHRNYHTVAQLMHISQPAISKRIRMLEDQLQNKLVERVGASMVLTPAGQALLPYCERIVAAYDEALQRLSNPGDWQGTIQLGAVDTILSTWLTDFLDRHQRCYPKVRIEVVAAPTKDLLVELNNGRIDIAMMLGPSYDRALVEVPLCTMEVGFYGRARTRLDTDAPPRSLSVEEIAEASVITFPHGSRPYFEVAEQLRQLPLPHQPRLSGCMSMLTLRSLAERGLGLATLPTPMAVGGRLERLDLGIALHPLTFAAAYRPAAAPPIYRRFCALAAETAADYARRNRTGIAVPDSVPVAP